MEDCVNIKNRTPFQVNTPDSNLTDCITILHKKLQTQLVCEKIDEHFSVTHAPPEPDHPNEGRLLRPEASTPNACFSE